MFPFGKIDAQACFCKAAYIGTNWLPAVEQPFGCDLDDLPDVVEYILDTNPQAGNGPFEVSGLYDAGSLEYGLAFDSAAGRTYVLEHKPDLMSASEWQVLDILGGTDASIQRSYPVGSSNGFYRVRVFPPPGIGRGKLCVQNRVCLLCYARPGDGHYIWIHLSKGRACWKALKPLVFSCLSSTSR